MFVFCFLVIFFFKQKTAYEMRISDWSSDVCSSDLAGVGDSEVGIGRRHHERARAVYWPEGAIGRGRAGEPVRVERPRDGLADNSRQGEPRDFDSPFFPRSRSVGIDPCYVRSLCLDRRKNGRASCRERGWQYVENAGV